MDKEEYLHLLRQASIADTSKFTPIDPNRPKTRGGRPSKHFHPLLQKEKELAQLVEPQSAVREVEGSSPRPDQHSGS